LAPDALPRACCIIGGPRGESFSSAALSYQLKEGLVIHRLYASRANGNQWYEKTEHKAGHSLTSCKRREGIMFYLSPFMTPIVQSISKQMGIKITKHVIKIERNNEMQNNLDLQPNSLHFEVELRLK
jgi:hypothetical protein